MKILITGLSGYLGQYLFNYKPDNLQVTGTCHNNSEDQPSRDGFSLDLDSVEAFIRSADRYDLVIHAAAMANLAECERNAGLAYRVNSEATEMLARWSQAQGSRFVYLSTDIVFRGDRGNYTEEDQPDPVNVYGRSKRAGERTVTHNHTNYVICRLSLVLGKAMGISKNFIDHFLHNLNEGNEIKLFVDEWRTPITPRYAAQAIWEIAMSDYSGVVHLCGAERINRYQLGLKIADRLNHPADNIKKAFSGQFTAYPRPLDVSLNSLYAKDYLSQPQIGIVDIIKDLP